MLKKGDWITAKREMAFGSVAIGTPGIVSAVNGNCVTINFFGASCPIQLGSSKTIYDSVVRMKTKDEENNVTRKEVV